MPEGWSYYLDFKDQMFELDEGERSVGRSRTCDISVNDPSVSRRHVVLKAESGRILLKDLGSSNGTFINGERIQETGELQHGDSLGLGDADLSVRVIGASAFETMRMSSHPLEQHGEATLFLQQASANLAQEAMEMDAEPGHMAPPAPADPMAPPSAAGFAAPPAPSSPEPTAPWAKPPVAAAAAPAAALAPTPTPAAPTPEASHMAPPPPEPHMAPPPPEPHMAPPPPEPNMEPSVPATPAAPAAAQEVTSEGRRLADLAAPPDLAPIDFEMPALPDLPAPAPPGPPVQPAEARQAAPQPAAPRPTSPTVGAGDPPAPVPEWAPSQQAAPEPISPQASPSSPVAPTPAVAPPSQSFQAPPVAAAPAAPTPPAPVVPTPPAPVAPTPVASAPAPAPPAPAAEPQTAGDVRLDQTTGDLLPSLDGFDVTLGPEMLSAIPVKKDEDQPTVATPAYNPYSAPTPEGQSANAGFGIRLVATLVDSLWMAALQAGAVFADLGFSNVEVSAMASGVGFLVVLFGWAIWGTTPGKRVFNLHVATGDGAQAGIGFPRALLRLVGYIASTAILGIGFLMILGKSKRGLHDLMAGTQVSRQ